MLVAQCIKRLVSNFKMAKLILLAILGFFSYTQCYRCPHSASYRMYRILPNSESQVELLELLKNEPAVEFWNISHNVGFETHVKVLSDFQNDFIYYLNQYDIKYYTLTDNIER